MKTSHLAIASVLLLFLSNEIISLAVIGVWLFAGLAWLMKAAGEGGAFN
jgi:hypothetical protein